MKIVALMGSPKGEESVTNTYVRFIESRLPEHEWTFEHVARSIRKIEKQESEFNRVIEAVRDADIVLWAFPVYVLLLPAGYKRFIELIHERGVQSAFCCKYAASLSTSIHFHDNCPHDYIAGISEDLGMAFIGSFSPEMYDLAGKPGQEKVLSFARLAIETAERKLPLQRRTLPLTWNHWDYHPADAASSTVSNQKLAIVYDGDHAETQVTSMVRAFASRWGGKVRTFNLRAQGMKGNCLGCLKCAASNRCAYHGADGFEDFYESELKTADVLVFAGALVDRHLSSLWRRFFERGFYNTHQPSFAGKQLAFLFAGPVSQATELREVLSGYVQWQEANLAGIVSDECGDATELDGDIASLASRLAAFARAGYVQPFDFQGVGGRKVFRDHIFGPLRFVFLADHRYYKQGGFYDFPTRVLWLRALNRLLGLAFRLPGVRKKFDRRMKSAMLMPFRALQLTP